MKKLLLILLLSCVSLQANAKPLTFHGVDWSMSVNEIRQNIEDKGYACEKDGPHTSWCSHSGNSEKLVRISDEWVSFSCAVYNGCSHSYDQMIKAISDKYQVSPSYTHDKEFEGVRYWDWFGKDGDFIRIFDDSDLGWDHRVHLYKGSYGENLDF